MHIFTKLFIAIFLLFIFFSLTNPILAASPACAPGDLKCIFGQVSPPPQVKDFGAGEVGIGKFLSNLISLIYTIAGIVLIFMLLWGSLEWLMSGGEKEKLAAAQKRIVTAIIGFILLAIAFPIIGIIGTFTGFELFNNSPRLAPGLDRDSSCEEATYVCPKNWDCVGGLGDDGHGCKKP